MRYLCLDIGLKRTGVALGDDETKIVSAVGQIESEFGGALLERIADMIEKHGPDVIVVGLPLNMDGTHGPQAVRVAEFASRIAERADLPVRLHDERLSSFAADQALGKTGLTHKQKKRYHDSMAAATILRDLLEGGPDFDGKNETDGST